MRTRSAAIGAGVGLTALACLGWAAISYRLAIPPPSEATAPVPTAKRPEITLEIRQYPADRHSSNCDAAVRVRLDIDRLRAYDLSVEDVMKAFGESTIVGAPRPVPPLGVVFVTRLARPDLYETLILRANAEGEIVRLKDVGKVDAEPGAAADGGAR